MAQQLQTLIGTAIDAAFDAGRCILEVYGRGFDVQEKADRSPLTEADLKAHAAIAECLAGTGLQMLSEEGRDVPIQERQGWDMYWLVDPLDGTKEFVSRNGEFTVNIALIEDGKPLWGLVYAPVLDRLWYGGKGMGTWRVADGKREAIQTLPHQDGAPWRVVGSRNHLSRETLDYLARFGDIERGEIELVSMGSSLKFCIIAEGGAELYPRLAPT